MSRTEENVVDREDNVIAVSGSLGRNNYHRLLATLYRTTQTLGYENVVLDFSNCTTAFPGAMIALCAQILNLHARNIDVKLTLPRSVELSRLFKNANWANLIDPAYDASAFRGYTHVPATRFRTSREQSAAVNSILNVFLGSLADLARSDFSAIEWALNEITDNVLTHSNSNLGGLVQVTTFERTRRIVEFVVADAGVGIPATLRGGHPGISSDTAALERAIREGITRDVSIGQGNGLFGTFRVCQISEGEFRIHSGHAALEYQAKRGLHIRNEQIPFAGTLIVARVNCGKPKLLDEALSFGGRSHKPTDLIELRYEKADGDHVHFKLRDEAESVGTRPAGKPVHTKLCNLLAMTSANRIRIDFDGVPLISSSFADEVFAKLFVELGALRFMRVLELVNVSDIVQSIIDRAISQRIATAERSAL